jgi:4-hydroxyphenylpyruvate dioxygenase-like putative hemolysin
VSLKYPLRVSQSRSTVWNAEQFLLGFGVGMKDSVKDTIDTAVAADGYQGIDHIAIAVRDLEQAIVFYRDVLGFTLMRRLSVRGRSTGMISAEMEFNGIRFVLCQGTEEASQVTRLINDYGPGVAHVAMRVQDVHQTVDGLAARGMEFDTNVIEGPGLKQAFSSRCTNSGLSFEFIQREAGENGFVETNVEQLFNQLEAKGAF